MESMGIYIYLATMIGKAAVRASDVLMNKIKEFNSDSLFRKAVETSVTPKTLHKLYYELALEPRPKVKEVTC
jgi:hypothetical protein